MNLKMNAGDFFGNVTSSLRGLGLNLIEVVFLVAALSYAGVVAYFYFTQTQPRTSKLAELRERNRVAQDKLNRQNKEIQAIEDQRKNADAILDSLKDFESRLKDSKHGISAVIDEVNALARANSVTAGDINFRSDAPEELDSSIASATPSASPAPNATPKLLMRNGKPLNVYEGLGIETTVEGDYHNLRRFISAFEQSRQFVIINSIALQSVDEKIKNQAAAKRAPQMRPGQMQGPAVASSMEGNTITTVSLKIQMETYFQREQDEAPAKAVVTRTSARN